MKRYIALIFCSGILLTGMSCAQQKAANSKKVSTKSTEKSTGTIQQVAMERTACFGQCPTYRIEVNRDGTARFIGRDNVEHIGVYTKAFAAGGTQDLLEQFAEHRVDTCSEEYLYLIADVPGLIYYITYKGQNEPQKIMNAHFGPDYLQGLAREMDKYTRVDDSWTKTSDNKNAE